MKLSELSEHILHSGDLSSKLIDIGSIELDDTARALDIPRYPQRSTSISFSKKNMKFPKGNLYETEKKAMALHSFANHELLAIEMMAAALVLYPHNTPELKRFKQGVLSSLKDEQKHFKLYQGRLNDLGYEFGDFPISDFFWKQMDSLKTPSQYLATISLTFEAANLDFAFFYHDLFRKMEDHKTADILETVLKEEISHVAVGVHYLNLWRNDKRLWDYYMESLPYPMTPARAKGKIFREQERKKAKFPLDFITELKNYRDDFKVTQRKEWKK